MTMTYYQIPTQELDQDTVVQDYFKALYTLNHTDLTVVLKSCGFTSERLHLWLLPTYESLTES